MKVQGGGRLENSVALRRRNDRFDSFYFELKNHILRQVVQRLRPNSKAFEKPELSPADAQDALIKAQSGPQTAADKARTPASNNVAVALSDKSLTV
ncbi:unnamed protein product, partial [Amoebophrya sp. A25]|eukprot:GSA25T00027332001.1